MRWPARVTAGLLCAGVLLVMAPSPASAHPLGNFTVNRYSGLIVATDGVTVDHVLDIAEIPTAQRIASIDRSGDADLSRRELARWARGACADAAAGLRLTVDGRTAPLRVAAAEAAARPGQAGLPVLRVECDLRAAASVVSDTAVRLDDRAAAADIGWREVTALGEGTTLVRSDVPAESASERLTAYPSELLSSPLDVSSATLVARPGGPDATSAGDSPASASTDAGLARGADRLTVAFEGLLARYDGGPLLALLGILGAVLLGAAHAVAPGHGKTIMAFYLSDRREGALRAAATVGATVTVTHTAGVLTLGLLVSAGTAFAPAAAYPWLGLVSGLLVVAVGLTLARSARTGHVHAHGAGPGQHTHGPAPARASVVLAVREPVLVASGAPTAALAPGHPAGGFHAHHDHGQDHDHGHGHDHDHGKPSRRGLVAIGLAGGLLPSPSALLVLLAATALGRPWFGVALVVAFGVGMAVTLAVVGLLVVRLRGSLEARLARRGGRLTPVLRVLPLMTAAVVTLLGAALALRGLSGTGLV